MARVCSLMLGAKKAGGSVDGDVVASIAETAEGSALLQLAAHLAALLAAPGPLGVISRGALALMARPRPIRGAEQGELVGTNLKGAGALRVRFALFVGGGSGGKEWKPGKDASQWWGRRDALCRSVAAALWRTEGAAWAHVEEVLLVFDDLGVLALTPSAACALRVPTERALVKRDVAIAVKVIVAIAFKAVVDAG